MSEPMTIQWRGQIDPASGERVWNLVTQSGTKLARAYQWGDIGEGVIYAGSKPQHMEGPGVHALRQEITRIILADNPGAYTVLPSGVIDQPVFE